VKSKKIKLCLLAICEWYVTIDGESTSEKINFIWTECSASGLHFGKKPKCKPDGVPFLLHFHLEMLIRWYLIRFIFWKKIVNRMKDIRFSNFCFKKP